MSPSLRTGLRVAAFGGLAQVLLPAMLFYGPDGLPDYGKGIMLAGTVIWFACSYFGFRQNPPHAVLDEESTRPWPNSSPAPYPPTPLFWRKPTSP